MNPLIQKLSVRIFWDTSKEKVNPDTHARWLAERVMMYGTLADFQSIKAFYGREKLGELSTQCRSLDTKTWTFCSAYFDIPKEQFRCSMSKSFWDQP
ncbi:MAG: hypothetical protein AAFQ98_09105 [Bacteroidota bacterium]